MQNIITPVTIFVPSNVGQGNVIIFFGGQNGYLYANAIIYFNAELLSSLLERGDPNSLFEMGKLGKISPVAWQHINFYGRFEFNDIATTFSVDEFIKSVDLSTLFIE